MLPACRLITPNSDRPNEGCAGLIRVTDTAIGLEQMLAVCGILGAHGIGD